MGRRYQQVAARAQCALLPPAIEDYVGADNIVRAIDTYVASLDLTALGFRHAGGDLTRGQPAFDPAALFKLYLYGYLNRVRSSRRLARECGRNLELIWLLEGLKPGYRSIAAFRAVNGQALRAACRDFVALCKELDLIGGEVVAIDGAFFNASASDASVTLKSRVERDLKQLELAVDAYCRDLDEQDAQERNDPEDPGTVAQLPAKLEQLKERQTRKQAQLEALNASGETQLSRTDPDARSLTKAGQHLVGYNVQNTVDAKHRLIINYDVTNDGNDSAQLAAQAVDAKALLGVDTVTVVADAGYYSEAELAACAAAGITVYVPIPDKHAAVSAAGRFSGAEFHYDAELDAYRCPGDQLLRPQGQPMRKNGVQRTRYTRAARDCRPCPHRAACLPAKTPQRQIWRSEHAELIAAHRQRMSAEGAARMRQRASLVEHPFGTLKRWCGWDHFLVRGFAKVRGEMGLLVLGYNLTRVVNILGVQALRDYCARRLSSRRMATPAVVAA